MRPTWLCGRRRRQSRPTAGERDHVVGGEERKPARARQHAGGHDERGRHPRGEDRSDHRRPRPNPLVPRRELGVAKLDRRRCRRAHRPRVRAWSGICKVLLRSSKPPYEPRSCCFCASNSSWVRTPASFSCASSLSWAIAASERPPAAGAAAGAAARSCSLRTLELGLLLASLLDLLPCVIGDAADHRGAEQRTPSPHHHHPFLLLGWTIAVAVQLGRRTASALIVRLG